MLNCSKTLFLGHYVLPHLYERECDVVAYEAFVMPGLTRHPLKRTWETGRAAPGGFPRSRCNGLRLGGRNDGRFGAAMAGYGAMTKDSYA